MDNKDHAFARAAERGNWTRRQVLDRGFKLGIASPLIYSLMMAAPEAAAAPAARPALSAARDQSTSSGTCTAIIPRGAPDIDPNSSYETYGSVVALVCYEMLLQYKGNSLSEVVPMLAESYQASADGLTYTFKIPAGVTFHDGTPCDAEAVRQSFIRLHDPSMAPNLVIGRFIDDPTKQITAVDPTTIQFTMAKPQPLFPFAVASSYGPFVVSPTAVQKNKTSDDPLAHNWFQSNSDGTGPYKLTGNDINAQITFEKFDNYHGGWNGNHFEKIVLRVVPENTTRRQLMEKNQADAITNYLTPEDESELKKNTALVVLEYSTTEVDWAVFNTAKLTVQARQGLSYAYPYNDVIQGVYKGLIKRDGPIASTVRGYDPNVFVYPTDLAKAKQLMNAGGLIDGATIDMMIISEDEIEKSSAELFQASLAQIGFNLQINQIDSAAQQDVMFGDQDPSERPMIMGSWAWWPDYNDPWNQLAPNFLKSAIGNGGGNAGAYINDQFETLMAQAANYTSETQLDDLMKQIQNILTEQDPPALYIGERQYFTILQKDIQGFVPNPLYLNAYNFYDMSRTSS